MKIEKNGISNSAALKTLAASLLAAAMYTAPAVAADVTQVINVTATIPSTTFTVAPKVGAWPQTVGLRRNGSAFDPYKLQLSFKSLQGVAAYLSSTASLSDGSGHNIPLDVKLNGTTLSTSTSVIKANTTPGTSENNDFELEIATSGTLPATSGVYTGSVSLVFEDTM